MSSARDFFKKVRIDTILRAILLAVMAVIFFLHPETAMETTSMMLAIFILCDGVFSLFVYFFTSGFSGYLGTTLLGSIFKILCGILLLTSTTFTTVMLSVLYAIYIIVVSCNSLEESMYLKRIGSYWVVPMILSVLSLAGGIVMLFLSPASMVRVSGIITGVTLTFACLEDIILIIGMYKAKKRIDSTVIEITEVQ